MKTRLKPFKRGQWQWTRGKDKLGRYTWTLWHEDFAVAQISPDISLGYMITFMRNPSDGSTWKSHKMLRMIADSFREGV